MNSGIGRRDVWRRNPWFWRAVIVMAALFALSSVPDDGTEISQKLMPPPAWHNFAHVPAYAVLTWLWWRALLEANWRGSAAIVGALALAFGYGIFDEIHQYFVPGRFLSATDALLNGAGCLVALGWILWRVRVRSVPTA